MKTSKGSWAATRARRTVSNEVRTVSNEVSFSFNKLKTR